jgi:hypothetical protein
VDVAGNVGTGSVTGVNVDLTAPSAITFVGGGLADGGSYPYLYVPAGPTDCTASDVVSGLASCAVVGYSSAVGTHVLTATATDVAGNTSTATLTYSVEPWTISGFSKPIDMTTWNELKAGNTTQLKFEVFAGPIELTGAQAVAGVGDEQVSCDTSLPPTGGPGGPGGPGPKKPHGQASVQSIGGHLSVRWDSPNLPGTCWRVTLRTLDGSSLSALFKLK